MPTQRLPRPLLIKLALGLLVLGVAAVLLLRGFDFKGFIEQALALMRDMGPFAFFAGMALLPAVGFPLIAFTLSVGPAYAEQLGLPLLLMLVWVSVSINLSLTYFLARFALRPYLEALVKRMGYTIPDIAGKDPVGLSLLVRLTPGPPFFIQSYLLGLARVPFWIYYGISVCVSLSYSLALVLFGDALMQGKGKIVALIVSVLVVVSIAFRWIRMRAKAKAEAALRQ